MNSYLPFTFNKHNSCVNALVFCSTDILPQVKEKYKRYINQDDSNNNPELVIDGTSKIVKGVSGENIDIVMSCLEAVLTCEDIEYQGTVNTLESFDAIWNTFLMRPLSENVY